MNKCCLCSSKYKESTKSMNDREKLKYTKLIFMNTLLHIDWDHYNTIMTELEKRIKDE